MKLSINMNDKVKVKLTSTGIRLLRVELSNSPTLFEMYTKIDTDGYSEFQLWELMSFFGKSVYNGCETPFQTDIKII